jgi:DnaD/phage-associated family protein
LKRLKHPKTFVKENIMAYRLVYSEFWTDPKVMEEMTPEDKFFYLYILTNPSTTSCGIYTITKKKMAFELGHSIETINTLMDRFETHHKLITYNGSTRELAIKNWGKYNLSRGGKPVHDCLISELNKVKDKTLIEYVHKNINNEVIAALYQSFYDTPSIGEPQVPPQVDNTYTDTNTSTFTKRDTYTDTSEDISTERKRCTDTIIDANTDRENDININAEIHRRTSTNTKIDKDAYKVTLEASEAQGDALRDLAIRNGDNTGTSSIENLSIVQPTNEEAHNLSVSLLKEYEKHTGHIGDINLGALKLAVIKHGYKQVKMAMDKALEKGKFSLSYINGILKTWAREGYPEEVNTNGIRSTFKNTAANKNKFKGFKAQLPRGLTEEEGKALEGELL